MYKVLLYFAFGAVIATDDATPTGNHMVFDTLEKAEQYGRKTGVIFEAVEVKEK